MRYRPDVVGTHRIYLNVNGQDLPGGPIETEVNQVQEVTETVAVTSQYEEGLMAFYFQCFVKFEKAVARRCSVKKLFLGISQNSQENTCARVPFLIKLMASGLQLY